MTELNGNPSLVRVLSGLSADEAERIDALIAEAPNVWAVAPQLRGLSPDARRSALAPWLVRAGRELSDKLQQEQFVTLAHDITGIRTATIREELPRQIALQKLAEISGPFEAWVRSVFEQMGHPPHPPSE